MSAAHRRTTRTDGPRSQGRTWVRAAVAVSGIAATMAAAPSAFAAPAASSSADGGSGFDASDLIQKLSGRTVITPDNAAAHGFNEPDTRSPGDVSFTKAYGDPRRARHGALGLTTPDSSSKATYFTDEKNGPLSAFQNSAAYSTYRSSSSTGNSIQYPSYQIAIDKNGGALESGDFSTLYYEPYYNVDDPATALKNDTWQRWDVTQGKLCSTRQVGGFASNQTRCDNGGLKSLSDIVAANPDATVLGFGLNQGSGNPGIVAAADLLTGAGSTYDFEVTKPVIPLPPTGHQGDPHEGGHHEGGHHDGDPHDGGHHGGKDGGGKHRHHHDWWDHRGRHHRDC